MFPFYRSLEEIGPEAGPSALSIGNFDGVHAGHRKLLSRTVAVSRERGLIPSVLTFDPHPAKVVAPERMPRLLTSITERISLMRAAGIQQILALPFDRRFSELSPEEFVRTVLHQRLQTREVLVGENFHFGHRQAGDVDTLRTLGLTYGFHVQVVARVAVRGRIVSSTAVRNLIEAGGVSLACRLLLRPYALEGNVVSGRGIGAKQTVPTLNLDTKAEVLPANGVYITRTSVPADGRVWPSITNIGTRPTFGGDRLSIETWLLSPLGRQHPAEIRVEFLRRVREERRFESAEALKQQIFRDAARANAYHRRLSRFTGVTPAP